ncbi:MAG: DEAD/DEAH box helicase [Candidatus Hecatellales archaeon B24]|nr:MAG: DEAD/DEAH box helicase [Candidatus Hecatellales archaeon B24]
MPQYFTHPLVKPETLEFRLYQAKILATCLKGNTLVVLPTGLGKTVIAMLAAAERLKANPEGKVVVLAPTRPLTHQHHRNFMETLKLPAEDFTLLTGETPPEKREKLQAKIVFTTPQAMENDVLAGRFRLEDVVLMVFDEAHRAVGNHSYVFLAEQYVKRSSSPLILALTASPGSTREQIEEVKRNLSIRFVEARTDLSPDVRPYVKAMKVEWVKVKLEGALKQVRLLLKEYLEEKIKLLEERKLLPGGGRVSYKALTEAESQLRRMLAAEGRNVEALRLLCEALNAKRVRQGLALVEGQGLEAFNEYFSRLKDKASSRRPPTSLKMLFSDGRIVEAVNFALIGLSRGVKHPKLEKLPSVLRSLLAEGARRIIVFTNYRSTAKLLEEELEGVEGVRAVRLVGHASRGEDKGLSQRRQVEALEAFKEGVYNVLVATQVGEEGLDISASDVVVFYDNVPSAVRFVQRRGRVGRRQPGKVVIFMAEGTSDEAYYWAGVHREKAMRKTITELQREEAVQPKQETIHFYLETGRAGGGEELKVLVDYREGGSQVVRELLRLGVSIELRSLQVADYVVSQDLAVERKRMEDFARSLMDGRLFSQARSLVSTYPRALLLVEGEEASAGVQPQALLGAMLSLLYDFKLPVIWVRNPADAARVILLLARREQAAGKAYPALREGKPPTLREIQEYIVAGLPGVERTLARRLLKEFGSVEGVFKADRKELTRVKGVGEKLAERIRRVIEAGYVEED